MKSKFCTYFKLDLDKELVHSIRLISKIAPEHFQELVRLHEVNLNSPHSVSQNDLSDLATRTNISIEELRDMIGRGLGLLVFSDEEKDSIEDIFDDIIFLKEVEGDTKENLLNNFKFLEERYQKIFKAKGREEEVVANKFQNILKLYCDPILVPYVDPAYDSQKHKINEYAPKMESIFPLISVRLRYKDFSKNNITISFCATEVVIDEMINELLAAKVKLTELRKVLDK